MKMRMKTLAAVALIAVAAVPLVAYGRSTPRSYSKESLRGAWAWSFSGQLASRYKYAQIGIATFDGKGGCVLKVRENSGANGGYVHNSSACSYEVAKDGLGRMDYSLDGEAGVAELVVGHGRVGLMSPDAGNIAVGEMLRLAPATGKAAAGKYSFVLDGSIAGERMTGVGTMSLTAGGKCTQTMVYNYGSGPQRTKTETCAYTFDEDGIAEADIAYDNGTGGDLYLVLAKRGRAYMLTRAEGEVIVGTAYRR